MKWYPWIAMLCVGMIALLAGPSLASGPTAAAVIFPNTGPNGTKVMVWACGFNPKPWNNGATPDHFAIMIDNTTVVATVPVSRCNNVSVGFGQQTQNPPQITINGGPGTHYVFVELVVSNGVGTLAPAVPFTIPGVRPLMVPCRACVFATATPTPRGIIVVRSSPPPPNAFVLSVTGVTPPNPIAGQPFTVNYSLTDTWKSFTNANTAVFAKLDGTLLMSYCQLVNSLNQGQTINRAVMTTAPAAGQHTMELDYGAGGCPGPSPAPTQRLGVIGIYVGPLAKATQTFTVVNQGQATPTPSPTPTPTPTSAATPTPSPTRTATKPPTMPPPTP